MTYATHGDARSTGRVFPWPALHARPTRLAIRLALVLALAAPPLSAQQLAADINESVAKIPAAGVEMVVTVFKPDGEGPFPLAIISHGRAGSAADRARVRRQRYPGAARYFVQRGFVVVVPTRKGYGDTGGGDPEDHGSCADPAYSRTFDGALESIVPALAWAKSLPYVDAKRILAVGTSMGGISTLALAARNPPGLIAAINFAGGKGGNPATRPGAPCAPGKLAESYAVFGKAARVPTLWLYAENDLFWGAEFPGQWHRAYVAAGGKAAFTALPPFGQDGHALFARAVAAWAPLVDAFLKEQGLLPK